MSKLIKAFRDISGAEHQRHGPFHTFLSDEVEKQREINNLISPLVCKLPHTCILKEMSGPIQDHSPQEVAEGRQEGDRPELFRLLD